jgi:hypothetical protein
LVIEVHRMTCSLSWRALTFAVLIVSLAGCHDDRHIATYPVRGVVKFSDGQPLAGGTILCESPHGLAARGIIESSGRFVLGTFKLDDGAVEGKHLVTVRPEYNPLDKKSDASQKSAEPLVSDRYQNFQTSGIEIEVKPDAKNECEIILERSGG